MNQKQRVLVVDDEETIRNLLRSRLEREGYEVHTAPNADEAQAAFRKGEWGVMITDLKMPGRDGFALTGWVKDKHPNTQVIVITGHGEKEAAVKSLRNGAWDYMEKPFDMEELSKSVKRAWHEYQTAKDSTEVVARLEARVERVEGKSEDKYWYVSKAESMNKANEWLTILRREAMRGGAEEPSVIVLGESGTGKEGIARMIHAGSRRAKGPWVAVNCANFNEQLLESELFGHEKGSFTGANSLKRGLFEIAKGGTLFLDEIGEMDVKLQAKLLRVLQERVFRRVGGTADLETDVRVVAATNRNLQDKIREGKFREDVYHRLSRVVVELPALRDRKEDLIPMATQFAENAFRSRGKHFSGFSPDAQEAIRTYGWPGNVRELLNVIERAALLAEGHGSVSARQLALPGSGGGAAAPAPVGGTTTAFGGKLELVASPFRTTDDSGANGYTELKKKWADSFEREYLTATLARHAGNVSAAAREARLDRSNFLRLLRRHGLKAQVYRKAA
jgi:DNA-binding NtrC family response regulator